MSKIFNALISLFFN